MAELLPMVLEHVAVDDETEQRPERKQEVRLRREVAPGDVGRYQQKDAEEHGENGADEPRRLGEEIATGERAL